MEALSAFPGSYLEEIMLTVLILSNLATPSGSPPPFFKGTHTRFVSFASVEMLGSFQSRSVLSNALCFSVRYFKTPPFQVM